MPSSNASERLQRIWYRASSPPWSLRLLSWPFALVVALRRSAYAAGLLRTHRLTTPVIVVGNISVGGTGKTPLVIWLVEQLRATGMNPGVVLRGYRGSARVADAVQRVQADSDPAQVGDEALLIQQRTGAPVAVGRDRVGAARHLMSARVDLIIADDGLQHLRLGRDYEIAVIDGARGMGNGYLLPAGPLREPNARLSSVGAVVVNGEGIPADLPANVGPVFSMRLIGEQLHPLSGTGPSLPLASFRGRRVHALAAIGNPERFFAQLRTAGLEVIAHAFPDHHAYRADELEFGDGLALLMTEKDAVKCRGFAAPDRWYLPVAASFTPEQTAALLARLQPVLEL
ncbi:MAG TPA: tetraacyldisaccharide 4'-kinase [Steroidobacteraceae bacterium]|nr:tetraacyldisaccharide 4'-kinase [Steroidobacteraceae bacterium]